MDIRKIDSFNEVFGKMDGGRILDIACGEGQFIRILQSSLRSWDHITGLDVNDGILKAAAGKFKGSKYHFVHGSSRKLPFQEYHFDLVSMSKGLHHVEDPEVALAEMKRVLKFGGTLVINEMYSDGLTESQVSHKMYHDLRIELDKLLGVDHFSTYARKEIVRMVEKLHLTDVQIFDYQEDQSDPMNAALIKEQSDKIDYWLLQIADHDKYDYFYVKIQELKERFRRVGFTKSPQLVIVGRKRERGKEGKSERGKERKRERGKGGKTKKNKKP